MGVQELLEVLRFGYPDGFEIGKEAFTSGVFKGLAFSRYQVCSQGFLKLKRVALLRIQVT